MADTNSSDENYEIILRQHTQLRNMVDELKRVLFERTEPFAGVIRRLTQFQSLLAGHFRLEEDSGCFGEVVNQAPRTSDRVAALIAEHEALRVALGKLVELVNTYPEGAADWDDISGRYAEFLEKLSRHETSENELLQEVFTEDIGSKD